jgi:hypothetical protein
MPVAYQGELWHVRAVNDDGVFLVNTYGKVIEVKQWNESRELTAA